MTPTPKKVNSENQICESEVMCNGRCGHTSCPNCGCHNVAPSQPSLKSPNDKIAEIVREFREKFPLLRVYPKAGQEIERFCDEEIKVWLTQTLTTLLNEE